MDPACLQYALTEEEHRHFEEKGFLVVRGGEVVHPGVRSALGLEPLSEADESITPSTEEAG